MILFFLRLLLIGLWIGVCCVIGLFSLFARWGDPDHDYRFARLFSGLALRIAGWKVVIEHEDRLQAARPCIYVANHQSNMDILPCARAYPRRCILIGKKEIGLIPIFGLFYVGAGNILLDRKRRSKAVAGLDQAVELMKARDVSIWIFPEGTRNFSSEPLLPFKKGAFYMAIQGQVPIVPVVLQPMRGRFDASARKLVRGEFRIRVLEPIPTEGLTRDQVDELLETTRSRMLGALHGLTALP